MDLPVLVVQDSRLAFDTLINALQGQRGAFDPAAQHHVACVSRWQEIQQPSEARGRVESVHRHGSNATQL